MNANRLLALYDRVADAPDAVARLRQFVLDLAVQGKLVEQDVEDEPALELLNRIEIERANLIRSGEIRQQKQLPLLSVDEQPFTIPLGWVWCRLGQLVLASDAGWSPRTENHAREGDAWGILKVSAVSWDYFDSTANKQVLPGTEPRLQAQVHKGDFLISRANTAELIARAVLVPFEPKNLMMSDKIVRLRFAGCCNLRFAWLVNNNADYARSYYAAKATGVSPSMKNVSRSVILELPIPLPPLAEQHRIVAKVDELMALCDRLETARAQREATRDRLTAASLARLSTPDADAETFRTHARFALDTLPALTARPDQIKVLRQSILDLAVRGKLVEQDAEDEPSAGDWRQADDDLPFQTPAGWRWSKFSDLATFENGDRSKKYPKRAEYVPKGVAWINTGHIKPDGTLCQRTMNYITEEKFDSLGGGKIKPGDILYCLRGATFGKTAFVEPFEKGAIASSLMIIRPGEQINRRYIYIYLTSPFGREQLRRFDNGTAQPNLSSASVKRYLVPLPPLAEQRRIVAKVDALMALCDQLEKSLAAADTARRSLLEALLHVALAPATEALEAA